jgi:CMP-N,N'-diacetyllegionaminic acid synthase
MKILFLIPARKGSKGLPDKNRKLLGGLPLINYTIDFAVNNLQKQDELCISTNDEYIIDMCQLNGILVPFIRPEYLATDSASINDVILHAINYYESMQKYFDAVLLLQPTSPFRLDKDLNELKNEFNSLIDMVVSVKLSKENPYFNIYEQNCDGFMFKSKNGDFQRRQDCPEVYVFNGSMYLINVASIKKSRIS